MARRGVSIALACRTFDISETCYRYQYKLSDDNARIADLLVGLTSANKTWGFGLCFLYLRNVQGYRWNHKRVYRIYRELELNLRIKPRKRLKRDKPDRLAVPEAPNRVWSMDFMADQLEDGRAFRLLNVLDDFNREGLRRWPKPHPVRCSEGVTSYIRTRSWIWHQVIVVSVERDTFKVCLSSAFASTNGLSHNKHRVRMIAALTVLKTRSFCR